LRLPELRYSFKPLKRRDGLKVAFALNTTMTIRLGCALLLLSAFQIGPQAPRPSLIVGQVVDAMSGRPAAAAVVAISGPPGPNGQPRPRVLTGSDGRFVFRDLRPGNYSIVATKSGFAEGAYGRRRAGGPSTPVTLTDGERVGDVVIRLWKHAAIAGTVVDESGERLIGVQVRAYRRSVIAGRRRFISSSVGATDDRGIYRIGSLLPGDYIVGTLSRHIAVPLSYFRGAPGDPSVRNVPMEIGLIPPSENGSVAVIQTGEVGLALGRGTPVPPAALDGRLMLYPPTFHPSTTTGATGAVITVAPGEEYLSADLQLTAVPTVRISGFLFGPEGALGRTVLRLLPANTLELMSEVDSPASITDSGGGFVFPAVPAGQYTVTMNRSGGGGGGPLWLEGTLAVGINDVDGVTLAALPGIRLNGRVEFDGDASRARNQVSSIQIMIEPADIVPGTAAFFARPSATGDFVSTPIPGGRYYVRIPNSPSGWMFKSATIDGRDVADVPFTFKQEPTNIVITFTDRWSGIRGSVQAAAGREPSALVLVFPTDPEAWGSSGLNPRRVRSTRTSRAGEYSFNLPPGEYFAVAVPEELSAEWQDPEFLENISRGAARVTIAEGERKVQDLRPKDIR
jgi:hypothetical protein